MMKRMMMVTVMGLFVGIWGASTSLAQEPVKGDWTGEFRDSKVCLSLHRSWDVGNGSYDSSFLIQTDNLKGLNFTPNNTTATSVHFELARDAGTVVFDGLMKDGRGIGDFKFEPNASYVSDLKGMGYDNV